MSHQPIRENDLHAWLDGELPPAQASEIEARLMDHRAEAEAASAYRHQKQALHQAFDSVLDEPLPTALRALAEPPKVIRPSFVQRWLMPGAWQRIAAGVVLLLGGGVAGWLGHGHYQAQTLAVQPVPLYRQAAIAHAVFSPDVRRPVEIGADHEDQLVAWLSKRLGTPVRPPKLTAQGFDLVGGRLLPGNSGPVAQFMYQDAGGQRLTLLVSTENTGNRDTTFRFAEVRALNVFYWIDGKFGYALSASVARETLAKVALAVYEQLEGRRAID